MFILSATLTPPPSRNKQPSVTVNSPVPVPPTTPVHPKNRKLLRLSLDTLSGQFRSLALLCMFFAILLLFVSYFVWSNVKNDFDQAIKNSTPSIVYAQQLGQEIQNGDADVANYQLYTRISPTSPIYQTAMSGKCNSEANTGWQDCAWQDFLAQRQAFSDTLFKARANITYPGEADAISATTSAYYNYIADIGIMKNELDQNHKEAALAAYKQADDILTGNLNNPVQDINGNSLEDGLFLSGWTAVQLKNGTTVKFDPSKQYVGIKANIQKLAEINQNGLTTATQDVQHSLTLFTILTIFACILLLAGLIFLNYRHIIVTHRLLSPGYAAALALALAGTILLCLNIFTASKDYQTVAHDSFVSINAAQTARQLLTDGNSDESRLLLSPAASGLNLKDPALTPDVIKAFDPTYLTNEFNAKKTLLQGQLDIAWGNITYSGEHDALCQLQPGEKGFACASNSTFFLQDYLNTDKAIRQYFNTGQLDNAIILDTSASPAHADQPNGSDFDFSKVDSALNQLSSVNAFYFDKSACSAIGATQFDNSCSGMGYAPMLVIGSLILFPLIALATIGGYLIFRNEL